MRRTAHKKGQSTHPSTKKSSAKRGSKKSPPKSAKKSDGQAHGLSPRQLERTRGGSVRSNRPQAGPKTPELCHHCSKDLTGAERALFVEEEVGRIFCSEACITGYFAPEIKRLEKDYLKKLSPRDLSGDERENLAHLRWATLQKPDETWREKTLAGDNRYTLISKFSPKGQKPVWCVCICLFLRGEPSFLYLAFPTQNAAMANHFRKGEQVPAFSKKKNKNQTEGESESTDRLAASWTEDDLLQAELRQARRKDDIPREQFEKYLKYFEETLEAPDEVWSTALQVGPSKGEEDRALGKNPRGSGKSRATRIKDSSEAEQEFESDAELDAADSASELTGDLDPNFARDLAGDSTAGFVNEDKRLYHFLRAYSNEKPILWYIIVARDTDEDEEIEILDSFPTHDESLVHRYRTGRQDVGEGPVEQPTRRVLH